ncbi:MAG: hypothetical protein KC486_12885 [Myxococcales bacterium]|nr:hypothetical protein [Myxococcales bacterium]
MSTSALAETLPDSTANTHGLIGLADSIFDRVSPYEGDGLRNHCRRLYHLATMLMEREGVELDRNVAYLVAMLHDLGLVAEDVDGKTYLHRSYALFEKVTDGYDLAGTKSDVLRECLLFNHRLLPVRGVSAQANCFRRAVQIEHTRGVARFGLDKGAVGEVFAAYPRDNFDRVLVDFTWRVVKREPWTLVKGIFF